ncbi:MAG: hypothetical protein QMC95_11545 [Desulfitobacteriaceae bacterium]|nr:hypothetical protein [Desulfitobacteriaceae bacterium]MDI6914841.1 hypothetical protein [Desulfitobacteriaceae bacterium]
MQKPVNISEIRENNPEEQRRMKTLATLVKIEEITQELQKFHRDNVESGKILETLDLVM